MADEINQVKRYFIKVLLMWGQQGGQTQWSQVFGGSGGSAHDHVGQTWSLVGVRGKSGALVDQLQFLFVDINTGQFTQSPRWGGNGGDHFTFQAPVGQWIDRISVRYAEGNCPLVAIQMETNTGMQSGWKGGVGGQQADINAKGRRITGVQVRSGGKIDAVGFLIGS